MHFYLSLSGSLRGSAVPVEHFLPGSGRVLKLGPTVTILVGVGTLPGFLLSFLPFHAETSRDFHIVDESVPVPFMESKMDLVISLEVAVNPGHSRPRCVRI